MSETSVLLIEPNRAHAAQIRQELSRLIDVTLIEHSSGEGGSSGRKPTGVPSVSLSRRYPALAA
jgi:hypothetical protein